jgi:predicted RNase H-like HicB family nuclease
LHSRHGRRWYNPDVSTSLQLVIQRDEDGAYIVRCPALKGCVSYGETLEAAMENIREAIAAHLEYMQSIGEEVPETVLIEV